MYLPINYDGLLFDEGLRSDVIVDDLIICELKALDHSESCMGSADIKSFKIDGKACWLPDQL